MKKTYLIVIFAGLVLLAPAFARAQAETPRPAETKAAREARLKWFDEAKYGLFINWGLYSIPAGEWKGKPVPTSASGSCTTPKSR